MFHTRGLQWFLFDNTITRRRLVNGVLQESCLDNILSSNPSFINDVTIVSPLGLSDHMGVLCDIKTKNDRRFLQSERENWGGFSVESISELGSTVNWEYSRDDLSVENMWDELVRKLDIFSQKVPKIKIKCTKNGAVITKSPWDCTALKRKRREKDKCWAVFDNCPNSCNIIRLLRLF